MLSRELTQNRILVLVTAKDELQAELDRAAKLSRTPNIKLNNFTDKSYSEILGRRLADTELRNGSVIDVSGPTNNLSSEDLRQHPRPTIDFGVSAKSSYLNRHSTQLLEFRKHILPLIVEDKLKRGDKTLQMGIIGPGFDEHASIMGALAREFASRPEWGDIKSWDIHIDLFDNNLPVLMEALERINGRSPLARYKFGTDKEEDAQTVLALNRDPKWSAQRMTGFYANAQDPNVIKFLKSMGYDALFMNATFLNLDSLNARRLANLFSTIDAFLLGDRVSDAPINHIADTHIIWNRINEDRFETDYAVAIPQKFAQQWQTNSTNRPQQIKVEKQEDKPRLRILLVTDDPDCDIEFWLRENLGCWSKHHNLNNAEIAVVDSSLPSPFTRKIANDYYDTVFIDANKLNAKHGRVRSFASLDVHHRNYRLPICIISDEPIELESYDKDCMTVLSKLAVMREDEITQYVEPIARKKGILVDDESQRKVRVSADLASLLMFVDPGPLYGIDGELMSTYHAEKFHEMIQPFVTGSVSPTTSKQQPNSFDISLDALVSTLEKAKLGSNAPEELQTALMNFKEAFLATLPEFLPTVNHHMPMWHIQYEFQGLIETLSLLLRARDEFSVCLQADQKDLEAYMSIYWGGCGYYKPRRLVLKERLIPDSDYGLKGVNKFFIKLDTVKPDKTDLAKAFNQLLNARRKLSLEIRAQLQALVKRLNVTDKEILGGKAAAKSC